MQLETDQTTILSQSFVRFLDSHLFFDKIFENDADGLMLLLMGSEALDAFDEFKEKFMNLSKEIFEYGLAQDGLKKREVRLFTSAIEREKLYTQRKCKVSVYPYIHTHYLLLTYSLNGENIKYHLPLERNVIILVQKERPI